MDVTAPPQLLAGILYTIPVYMTVSRAGKRSTIFVAIICSGLLLAGMLVPTGLAVTTAGLTGRAMMLGIIGAVAWITLIQKQTSENLSRYIIIVDSSNEYMSFICPDYTYGAVNKTYHDTFHKSRDETVGRHVSTIIGQDRFIETAKPNIDKALAGETLHFERWAHYPVLGRRYMDLTYQPCVDADGTVRGVIVIGRDITDKYLAEESLAKAQRLNELILNSAGDGIFGIDGDGRVTFINPVAGRLIGWEGKEITGQSKHEMLHHTRADGNPYPLEQCPIYATLRSGNIQHVVDDVFWRKDGTSFPVEYTSTPITENHEVVGAVVVFNDISERKSIEARLRYLATHDELTGLPGLRLLKDRLANAIALAQRNRIGIALLFLDLDGFKGINDSMGHKAGDQVLVNVAERLQHTLRESDSVARVGGDEFIVLINQITGKLVPVTIASKVLEALTQPMQIDGKTVRIGTSIGIALYPDHGTSPDELIKTADAAMYAAKSKGKNNVSMA